MGRQDEDREAARERRRAYYESLSPEEKKAYREKVIRARKIRKLRKMAIQGAAILLLVIVAVIGVLAQKGCDRSSSSNDKNQEDKIDTSPGEAAAEGTIEAPGWVIEDFVRIHEDSRPGTKLTEVEGIVIHATGRPGTSAEATRSEFDKLDKGEQGTAASHFIIGIDGTVIQCIPLSEVSPAAGANGTAMISIECCHIDSSGKFSNASYDALKRLVGWLLDTYDLAPEAVLRHSDVSSESCPAYYVVNLDAWNQFMTDIGGTPIVAETPEETAGETPEETGEETSAAEDEEE